MIYHLMRILKASRWIIIAIILLYVILRTPRILVKNGTQKSDEGISSKFNKLISGSNITSKSYVCMKEIEIKWPKLLSTIQIFNSFDLFINTTTMPDIYLPRRYGSKNYGVDFKHKQCSTFDETNSNFMPWTEKSLKKINTISFRHILHGAQFKRSRSSHNDQDNSMISFIIIRIVQLLNDFSNTNRYLYHNKLTSCSFICRNLQNSSSSTSIQLLQKNIPVNFYQDYYFHHMPIRSNVKSLKFFLNKLHLVFKIPMESNRIPAGLSARSNNSEKNLHKRQPSNPLNCRSLLGNKPQTCKKARKTFIIFYILLSFAGACCIMLGAVQFWNHRKQSRSKLTSPPRNKIEKTRRNIPQTLRQHEISSSPTREANFTRQNPGRDERNYQSENVSLRVDGVNDKSSISVPKQENTGKHKYATFPLCAASSRNLAPTIPELQLPKPSLVSIRRLTGFSSDESSSSGSYADQNTRSSSRS